MNSPHLPCTSLPSPQAKIRKNRRERQIVWVRRSNNEVQIPSSPLLGNVLPWLQTLHFVFITPGWLWISDMHIGKLSIFSSVAQSCLTFCNLVDYNTPGFPVHHQVPKFTQAHVHWVGGAIQPFHPLSSPSRPAFSLSQHQGLFKWVSSSHQVAKVLEFQLWHQSFQWIFRTDLL